MSDALRRKRVLVVGPFPPTKGGVTTFMLNLMASPLRERYEFVAYSTGRPPKKNVTENWGYGAILRGGLPRIGYGIVLTLYNLLRFPLVLAKRQIDIVQIQASDYQMFWEGIAYVQLTRLMRRRALLRLGGAFDVFHGGASRTEQRMLAAALQYPHYLVAQCEYARDYMRRVGRAGPMVLLPNWTAEANIAPLPRAWAAAPVCLFIANTEATRKGMEEVFEAARMLMQRGCPARFRLVAMAPRLTARLAEMELTNIVRVEGPLAHHEMLASMLESHIFLLPSHAEGFPNSLVEAMAAGMACIATPVGAVPEMTGAGEALIVPAGDAAALADAIERITASPALFASLASAAQLRVRSAYVAASVLPALAAAYDAP